MTPFEAACVGAMPDALAGFEHAAAAGPGTSSRMLNNTKI
jgi:hypothetical protein